MKKKLQRPVEDKTFDKWLKRLKKEMNKFYKEKSTYPIQWK